jgi:hypothetical protein
MFAHARRGHIQRIVLLYLKCTAYLSPVDVITLIAFNRAQFMNLVMQLSSTNCHFISSESTHELRYATFFNKLLLHLSCINILASLCNFLQQTATSSQLHPHISLIM